MVENSYPGSDAFAGFVLCASFLSATIAMDGCVPLRANGYCWRLIVLDGRLFANTRFGHPYHTFPKKSFAIGCSHCLSKGTDCSLE